MSRKLRMGMVGGGLGGFIGGVHRMAARLDGKIDLVAGCFSSNPEKSHATGQDLHLDPARVYDTYEQMIAREQALPADERIDFVSIVTRNNTHVAIARAFLEGGFHVICDKPLGYNLAEALELREVVQQTGKVFALTHNYTGYPLVKEARHMVRSGELGEILKIVVEYPQGYAITALGEKGDGKIAGWRQNPDVAGASNCMGDIGTHAENLVRYITGLRLREVCADLSTYLPGRVLDDDGSVLCRWEGRTKGVLFASQVSNGDENNLNIRVWGTNKSIHWFQEFPNELIVKEVNQPRLIKRRGNPYLCAAAQKNTRLPFGHQEAFIEAFANTYMNAAEAILDAQLGNPAPEEGYDFPTVEDGVLGNAFIETVVKSSRQGSVWTEFPKV